MHQNQPGFSIIELVVAMSMIAVIMMFALPNIDYVGMRVNGSARAVSITLMNAQRLAVLRQHAVIVAFDTVDHGLRVHEDRDSDGTIEDGETVNYVELEDGIVFARGAAPAHSFGANAVSFVKRQGNLPAITFARSGSAGENGGFYIASSRSSDMGKLSEVRAFEVNRATGRAVMFAYAGGAWQRSF